MFDWLLSLINDIPGGNYNIYLGSDCCLRLPECTSKHPVSFTIALTLTTVHVDVALILIGYFISSPFSPDNYRECVISNPSPIAALRTPMFISFSVLNFMQYPVTLAFPIFFPYVLAKYVLSSIPRT